ncbi:MAG: Fic family protein [Coriobacteriales bacterium]|nr:Fic family protein [Coriobacteriales bacterium]
MEKDPFKYYIKNPKASKADKAYAWYTGIGLQAVDGLETSPYLRELALKNIEGKISFDKVYELLDEYYDEKPAKEGGRTREADIVSARISQILEEPSFNFTPNAYLSIHKRLFDGVFMHAGQIRDYNLSKKEWVLNGKSVLYGNATDIRKTLEYDLQVEKSFSFNELTTDEIIKHLAIFVAHLWQNHVFGEGNTRTTAVFFIKYIRSLGFNANNDIFAQNAWYFRNALVRANYNDLENGISATTSYLELLLRNLLLGEDNELKNRYLHVSYENKLPKKADIGDEKADIGDEKADIGDEKADIELLKTLINGEVSYITLNAMNNIICTLYDQEFFGRNDVMNATNLKHTRATELIKLMLANDLIVPVKGHGKGKYCFSSKIGKFISK